MKPRTLVGAIVSLAALIGCVGLSGWQWSKYRAKQHRNVVQLAALAAPPVALREAMRPGADPRARRVLVAGEFDERRQVLLDDRWHEDDPGVEVVTPLRLAGGGAIVVDRGWLPSTDGVSAHPEQYPEPGTRRVVGLLEPMPGGAGGPGWERLPGPGAERWSVRRLDRDSLAAHLPYALAPFVLRALPEPAAPRLPAREPPAPLETAMHLSYALQWLAIALIIAIGSAVLVRRDLRARAPGEGPPNAA